MRRRELDGAQVATVRRMPAGRTDPDAVELATALGLPLMPWQAEILTHASAKQGDRWSAREVCALVPRQNGKSFLTVARMLAGALLYGEKLILYSAHEYRTAQETWRLLRDIAQSDGVAPLVKRIRMQAGGEELEFHNGCRIKPIARTRTSGRGFSPDAVLLDEAFAISPDVMAAITPALAARPNPQLWYLSSAGSWESAVLLDIRKRGHQPHSTLAYWEWHADEDCDIHDPKVHAATNPSYGRLIHADAIRGELESMSRRAFMRERLGVWSETTVDPVLAESDVDALLVDVPPPPTDGRVIGWGVDTTWDRSGAAIAAAFRDLDGRPVVTIVESRPAAGWLPGRLAELATDYPMPAVAYDARGGINDLMERAARDHDIPLLPLRHRDYPTACADVAQRVTEHSIHFGRAPLLISDLTGAIAQELPSGWVWSRKTTTPPTYLIAATCALAALEREDGNSVAVY